MVITNGLHLVTLSYQPFSPLVLASGIDVLPHQLAALYGDVEESHKCSSPIPHKVGGIMRVGFPVRALIADETGLGKTIISGLFIFSLLLRNIAKNIIIVAPKSVTAQWQEELFHKFGIYFKTVEHGDELLGLAQDSARSKSIRVVVSLDLVKGNPGREFVSRIPEKGLDLVVIDEAHHVITRGDTLRYQIARCLARRTKSLLLLSATPFRGYYEAEYNRILELLGPNFVYIRRFKDQVKDANGTPLFPRRVSYKVVIDPDPSWYQVYLKIERLIKSASLNTLMKFVLLKRLSSSLHALSSTLKKIGASEEEDPFDEDTDDVYSTEPDVRGNIYGLAKGAVKELQAVQDIITTYLSQNKLSLKEREFLKLLGLLIREHKVVVFTEYRSTLDRLRQVLDDNGVKYTYVHGQMSLEERRHAIQAFWNDRNIRVFLATDAAGEGINLQVASYQINYDLPWSPFKLEQRFGRIHRYGQKHTTYVYNLAVKGTLDDRILVKVVKKLENVVRLLGEWVFDYIGEAIEPNEIRKVVMEDADVITEETIAKRLEVVHASAHDPKHDYDYARKQIESLKSYVKDRLQKEEINVLEVLRLSELVTQDTNWIKRRATTDGYAVAVYRVNGYIGLMYSLEKIGNNFLDPFNNSYVSINDVKQYLEMRTMQIAEFYGYKNGHVEIYGI